MDVNKEMSSNAVRARDINMPLQQWMATQAEN